MTLSSVISQSKVGTCVIHFSIMGIHSLSILDIKGTGLPAGNSESKH